MSKQSHIEQIEHVELEHSHEAPGTLYENDVKPVGGGRVLIPRPSNDPNDPLTWSTWEKVRQQLV